MDNPSFNRFHRLGTLLFSPVDNSPLVIFRIIFGALIFMEAWGAIATGWVKKAFITPKFTFPFIDFSWLQPLPGWGMYAYYLLLGIAGIMIMLGWRYRVAIITYTIMWAGVYFMQKTHYNNHYYLLLLLLSMMCFVPAHQYASMDCRRNPKLKSLTCPQWCLWIFAAQIFIVYSYGAIAKMYPDWLNLKPISIWFSAKGHYPLVGPLLQEKWMQYLIAYGGIAFDSLIVPALLWKKTRKWAFILSIGFHLFNSFIFQVGIFPYLGISWSLFFFPPETIRRIFLSKKTATSISPTPTKKPLTTSQRVVAVGLTTYVLLQILIPLRHHVFEGDVYWTEEGHRMAWRMMARTKQGRIQLHAFDPHTNKSWKINMHQLLTQKQISAVATSPDMCWQYVQKLKKDFVEEGFPDIEIYAKSNVRLNRSKPFPLYDPNVNLAEVQWEPFKHAKWVLHRNPEDFSTEKNVD